VVTREGERKRRGVFVRGGWGKKEMAFQLKPGGKK